MREKRAVESLQAFLVSLILAIFVFIALLAFIRNSASGSMLKEQILAKEIASLIDNAQPGTELNITRGNFIIDIVEKRVIVRAKASAAGYSYDFSSPYTVTEEAEGTILKVKIA